MTEPPRRYDITITVDQDSGHHPNPAEFAVAAQQAASAREASIVSAHTSGQIVSIVSAHTSGQIVSIVTVLAAHQPAAVAVALAVVSDALNHPAVSSTR